jgi:hypothetical protein
VQLIQGWGATICCELTARVCARYVFAEIGKDVGLTVYTPLPFGDIIRDFIYGV